MRGEYVFDLPVYRCPKEWRDKKMVEAVEAHIKRCFDDHGLPRSSDPDTITRITGQAQDSFGGPWEFNEIVGWVRLFPENVGIGAHVWFTEGKKLTRKMKKLFRLRTWSNSMRTHFPPPVENATIYEGVLKALDDLAKRDPVKGRILDLSVFKRIGPYVDWRRLILEGANATPTASELWGPSCDAP